MVANISQPAISTSDPNQSNYFYLSRPAYGENSADNISVIFLGPRTIISRLSVATGATGQILQTTPPAVNSSYTVPFYGPYVQCQEANGTVASMIDSVVSQNTGTNDTELEIYNTYYAYVPDLSSPDRWGTPNTRTSNSSRSSNQLWMSFKQNGTGWDETLYPKCPLTTYRVCRLYNASYDLTVTFKNGNMSVSYPQPTILTDVDYPTTVVNASMPAERMNMAYSAYMWAFTDLLIGNMGLYVTNITFAGTIYNTNFENVLTNLQNTALLGSSDLDCFFGLDWMYHNETWAPPSPQRGLDIEFARHEPFDVLIPELSANLTISLMADSLLAYVPHVIYELFPTDAPKFPGLIHSECDKRRRCLRISQFYTTNLVLRDATSGFGSQHPRSNRVSIQ